MPLSDVPERILQRAAHLLLGDPARSWKCTNGDQVQVVAAGLINVHSGPDLLDTAVLFDGTVFIGDVEFHFKASDWVSHKHGADPRYASLLMHIVVEDDLCDETLARWTLVMPRDEMKGALKSLSRRKSRKEVAVEELQHFALLRLLRSTADADANVRRLGVKEAIATMTASYLGRLQRKRMRPRKNLVLGSIRDSIAGSAQGLLVQNLDRVKPRDLFGHLNRCDKTSIAGEGLFLRREVLINAVLPLLCVRASHQQRVVLLQWYWSVRAVHAYGILRRRFPDQVQNHVWQQQGMLEYMRQHGGRSSTCAEAIREYGLSRTVEFLDASHAP